MRSMRIIVNDQVAANGCDADGGVADDGGDAARDDLIMAVAMATTMATANITMQTMTIKTMAMEAMAVAPVAAGDLRVKRRMAAQPVAAATPMPPAQVASGQPAASRRPAAGRRPFSSQRIRARHQLQDGRVAAGAQRVGPGAQFAM